VIVGAALACGAACGGEGGGGISPDVLAGFEGVYQLDAATENPSACDLEGPSVLDTITQKQFVAIQMKALTVNGLQLVSCADDAGCASTATMVRAGGGWGAEWGSFLSSSLGSDQLGGFSASSGFLQGSTCVSRTYNDLTLTRQSDTLRLETRTTALADVPADNGTCWADPTKERAEAAALPCSSLRVLTGSKRGPLP
jgi:hypothetical protein